MRKKILVVDDELLLARSLKRVLEKRGFEVYMVTSVAEAMAILTVEEIDLCITDLAMPAESGIDLLKKIRTNDRLKDLPVIVQSGFSRQAQKEVLALNPVRIFSKPVPLDELIRTIQEQLGA